ncbi:uncharacterized protein A4U43_C08F3680 [Asparagus officinalis]|uniref:F-box protein At3g07870-like isoform X2 n=2 Tax=Asparagus officinalis TaxID=4686 RepID=UPI00098E8710|nr:F-box protein At3g07870-like isoform X2 [Asparagus officinalis]ONK59168.1 uncharacterized protein A4U43_C08F3680 [Asparagus officinalis]
MATHIPVEIIIQILEKLPSRSLLRFKSVCKLWRSIIQGQDFIIRHLHNNNARASHDLSFVTLFRYSTKRRFIDLRYFIKEWGKFEIRGAKNSYYYDVSNSCNGLICVFGSKFTYVVNPSIGDFVELPTFLAYALPVQHNVALVHDAETYEYKVIRTFTNEENSSGCFIFTLGSSTSWRFIGCAPFRLYECGIPAVVNNNIYWSISPMACHDGPEIGVSLNIKNETFDIVMHPDYTPGVLSRIYEVGGDLCILDSPNNLYLPDTLDWNLKTMWTLKDYRNKEWIKHDMNLNNMQNLTRSIATQFVLVGIRNGKILTSHVTGRFDFYDPETGHFEMALEEPHQLHAYALHYVESLISPTALQNSTK